MRKATVLPLTYDAIGRIHRRCARSIFWEIDPLAADLAQVNPEVDKEAWLTAQAFVQGTCGYNIVERDTDKRAFGTVVFCASADAPGALRMPAGPVSADAFLLSSLHIDSAAAGRGWEAVLLDASIMTLTERGAPAVEAFGYRPEPTRDPTEYAQSLVDKAEDIGLARVDTLEGAGFKIVHDHPLIPRLRLELPPQHDLLSAHEIEELLQEVPAAL